MTRLYLKNFFILSIVGLVTSCTLPKIFHQHIPEPVAVPEMKKKNTKNISFGHPGELSVGYHLDEDLYTEAYIQRRGLATQVFEAGNVLSLMKSAFPPIN